MKNANGGTLSAKEIKKFPRGKSNELWRQELTHKEYLCLIEKNSEVPWKGKYLHKFPKRGYFACRGCKAPLYSTKAKFDAGLGWASFQNVIKEVFC